MHPAVLNYKIRSKYMKIEHSFINYLYGYMFRPHRVTSGRLLERINLQFSLMMTLQGRNM